MARAMPSQSTTNENPMHGSSGFSTIEESHPIQLPAHLEEGTNADPPLTLPSDSRQLVFDIAPHESRPALHHLDRGHMLSSAHATPLMSSNRSASGQRGRGCFPLSRVLRRGTTEVRSRVHWLFSSDGRDARTQLGLFFRLLFTFSQIVIITVILFLSATVFDGRGDDPSLTEWEACSRPLGIWSALWAGRAVLSCAMNVWEWKRHLAKKTRRIEHRVATFDGAQVVFSDEVRAQPSSRRSSGGSSEGRPITELDGSGLARPAQAHSGPVTGPPVPERPRDRTGSGPRARGSDRPAMSIQPSAVPANADAMFEKCDTFLTVLALAHFVGNHYLLYTSVHTCRLEAPHVWWLAFGIVSLGYIIVLELLLIAFVVFILGPVLLLILNLLMLCMGRPFDRHGNVQLRPEIPKLEVRWIDQIPLAVYAPPPSEDIELPTTSELQDMSSSSPSNLEAGNAVHPIQGSTTPSPSTSPNPTITHTCPPQPKRRPRLRFRKSKMAPGPKLPETRSPGDLASSGDPRFDKHHHPLVYLERNRATCPICLTDFVEPPRRQGVTTVRRPIAEESPSDVPAGDKTVVAKLKGAPSETASDLKSHEGPVAGADAAPSDHPATETKDTTEEGTGVPGEPLRLLACGHAFHKQCLDPWLSSVSGRCPVCSQKVEVQEKPEKKSEGPSPSSQ